MACGMRARRGPGLLSLTAIAAALLPAACGGDGEPPPRVARESAGAQVKRVSVRWSDTVEEEGFLEKDPHGVLQFRVVTTRKLSLGDGTSVSLRIERDETFHTKLGTFRCKAGGELTGSAVYTWQSGEAEVRVSLPSAELPRTCETAGFPVMAKSLGAATMVFLLRSDRLVGKTSARDRTVLLPLQ
jgi:hypothetical protein